ncbi:MAG TPA: uL15 family ribosomal protein [archaeon]|nr:uL15 family ribosomal protein [archaeon]
MTATFRKKNSRERGKTTHGWGTKKKHRGSGSRGGAGFGGVNKGKWTWVTAKMPDYFGKKGFFPLRKKPVAINISGLEKISGTDLNLSEMGYDKLLSKGSIKRAVTVKVASCSARAKEKIEKAGGKVIQ